eukprot:3235324-Prymnesium_polylepis.1
MPSSMRRRATPSLPGRTGSFRSTGRQQRMRRAGRASSETIRGLANPHTPTPSPVAMRPTSPCDKVFTGPIAARQSTPPEIVASPTMTRERLERARESGAQATEPIKPPREREPSRSPISRASSNHWPCPRSGRQQRAVRRSLGLPRARPAPLRAAARRSSRRWSEASRAPGRGGRGGRGRGAGGDGGEATSRSPDQVISELPPKKKKAKAPRTSKAKSQATRESPKQHARRSPILGLVLVIALSFHRRRKRRTSTWTSHTDNQSRRGGARPDGTDQPVAVGVACVAP